MAEVVAICISKEKGTRKDATVKGILKEGHGLVGDAHADYRTRRQVSLLAVESINKMRELGFDVGPGDFAENITTKGLELTALPLGTRISVGRSTILEITQIGKECHGGCAIYRKIGKCIMPVEGLFARVIRGGFVSAGDRIATEANG
jgi:MOSC domain-containing protein YiiM